jgi:homoserine dehydrogenase
LPEIIVLKVGSSVLRARAELAGVVHEIYRWYRLGRKVVVVVSAIGKDTEQLLREARKLAAQPEPYATAELLASGQSVTAALLGIALDRAGVQARVLNPREVGLTELGAPLDSEPVSVNSSRIGEFLTKYPVLVISGVFGTDAEGRTHLLARGGSGLTATLLSKTLETEGYPLIKIMDGVEFRDAPLAEPLKVLLLGLGTVGFGVYQSLLANPEDFKVAGVLVRDRGKYERQGVPETIVHTRIEQIVKLPADVVVDALPGIEPSLNLVQHFLSIGVPVVSANKVLIADSGPSLITLGRGTGAALRFSAAVGGAVPMIEAIERVVAEGRIISLAAVLNGTCNFVLVRCRCGMSLGQAVAEAQEAGFAEQDASEDLSGRDAARKLRILVRQAFAVEPRELAIEPLDEAVAERARQGRVIRQVARAELCDSEVRARVSLEEVPGDSVFALLQNEWNGLQIATMHGNLHTVTGRGAGRWPTTEAVLADLFDLRRAAFQK